MALLPTIVSGVAGWLTYEDMCAQVIHHDEHDLYKPITRIAEQRGFSVYKQFPKPKSATGRGAPKQIDFVFGSKRRKEFLVLEVKFKRTPKQMAGSISADAKKIRDVDAAMINQVTAARRKTFPACTPSCKIEHAVLIVWREGSVLGLLKKEKPPIQIQLVGLFKYMLSDPQNASDDRIRKAFKGEEPIRPVTRNWGHLRFGSTQTPSRYWVAALRKRTAWSSL